MKDWKAWLVNAQAGNLEAFDLIIRQFQHMVVGYAYSVLGDFQMAEDAAK